MLCSSLNIVDVGRAAAQPALAAPVVVEGLAVEPVFVAEPEAHEVAAVPRLEAHFSGLSVDLRPAR